MIDARELRIGNIVNANGVQIAVDFINVDDGFPENYLINDWYEEDLEPIPLTEQWLIKLGFEKVKSETTYTYNDETNTKEFIYVYEKDGFIVDDNFVWSNYLDDLIRFQHVHQLQNLYFALTGEELTIQHL